ncbi:hypothetical protein ET33_33160 [Paenibacillus tyrfis]|uniref:Uncharacterized protein n=1 Tax=Paenibacillus tyrfis TaxID=1501230 RepID=A0A081P7L5_9BACL|nr:hypothetical protein ET33_33160 [Paenibacillus tyrfis]
MSTTLTASLIVSIFIIYALGLVFLLKFLTTKALTKKSAVYFVLGGIAFLVQSYMLYDNLNKGALSSTNILLFILVLMMFYRGYTSWKSEKAK